MTGGSLCRIIVRRMERKRPICRADFFPSRGTQSCTYWAYALSRAGISSSIWSWMRSISRSMEVRKPESILERRCSSLSTFPCSSSRRSVASSRRSTRLSVSGLRFSTSCTHALSASTPSPACSPAVVTGYRGSCTPRRSREVERNSSFRDWSWSKDSSSAWVMTSTMREWSRSSSVRR